MEYLNPRNDIAFKKIFGADKNKDILIHFLNDVLNKTDENRITEVTICNPTQSPEIIGSKESVLDVLCTDANKVQYIVEMQCNSQKGFEKRAQYYATKAYATQAQKSGNYYNLKEVIFLAILDYEMFPHKTHYKSDHVILDKQNHDHDLRDFYFTFIELPKFNKESPRELVTYEEKWCYFFKHAGDVDAMRKFLTTLDDVGIIQKAYDVLEAHNWSKQELIDYEAMEKIRMDARAREAFVVDEAEARGEINGIWKEKLRTAHELKKLGANIEMIIAGTGLSKEEIERLN